MPPRNLYTLAAPAAPDDFRYVGATVHSLPERFHKHLSDARTGATAGNPVGDWLRGLLGGGLKPVIAPLEGYGSEEDAIAALRAAGYDLLNVGDGGEGREPISFTDEQLDLLGTASDRAVAQRLGCHWRTVYRRRHAAGIAPGVASRSGAGNHRRFLDCEVRALRRLYAKGAVSAYGMARAMGVSETTVRRILKGTTYPDAGGPLAS